MSLDGKSFFYVNPLEVTPQACHEDHNFAHVKPVRQKWFGCACCPPNLARLMAQMSEYAYAVDEDGIYTLLYGASRARVAFPGKDGEKQDSGLILVQETGYPYDGNRCV